MKDFIVRTAFDLGFAAVGVTSGDSVAEEDHLTDAIARGRIAGMAYIARSPKSRCDPQTLLPGAKSVICCAMAYGENGFSRNSSADKIKLRARYARGEDYHEFISSKLKLLWDKIKPRAPDAKSKFCVDTSPIMEKALAQRAGIGWIGKHTIVVNKKFGSWFMLGEIITDIELAPDTPVQNQCGKCTSCIDACPTGALIGPQTLDAGRCISYLTTALKGEFPGELRRFVSAGTFGCDKCQEACPYNRSVYTGPPS